MSDHVNGENRQELRDSSGRALGTFVPSPVFQELAAERDGFRAEVEQLRQRLAAEQAKRVAAEEERDGYLKALMLEVPPLTAEEVADMDRNGVELGQIIAELEEEWKLRNG